MSENILTKVHRLVALAACPGAEIEERRTAAVMACVLIAEHKLLEGRADGKAGYDELDTVLHGALDILIGNIRSA